MPVRPLCGHAAARRALDETQLQQIGLIDILERARVLAHRTGKGRQAYSTAGERLGKRLQDTNIHPVQTELIDLEELKRLATDIELDGAVAAHLWVALKHEITYRKPAFMDDEVIATVLLEKVHGARAFYQTIIKRGEEVLAEVQSSWCCISVDTMRPTKIAHDIARHFRDGK